MQKIAQAFIAAKKHFSPALKRATNPHFKNQYADLAACLEAVDDALLASGIVMYQETFEDMTGVTVETVLLHESGETIRCGRLHVPAAKQDPQGYGSALTYARRYSLMTACGIAPEDDDGNAASKKADKPEAKQAIKQMDAAELSICCAAMRECDEMEALQSIYAAAYRRGNATQKGALQATYNAIKEQLTTKEQA